MAKVAARVARPLFQEDWLNSGFEKLEVRRRRRLLLSGGRRHPKRERKRHNRNNAPYHHWLADCLPHLRSERTSQLWISLDSESMLLRNLRFGPLTRESYASPALDTTNLPREQAHR